MSRDLTFIICVFDIRICFLLLWVLYLFLLFMFLTLISGESIICAHQIGDPIGTLYGLHQSNELQVNI